MGSKQHPGTTRRPVGVVILSILATISGIQLLASSIWSFAVSANAHEPAIADALTRISPEFAAKAAGVFFLTGLLLLAMAVSSLLLARGYYLGKEKARKRGRFVSAVVVIWGVLGIIVLPARADPASPLWTILINGIIIVYLGRPQIRSFFRI